MDLKSKNKVTKRSIKYKVLYTLFLVGFCVAVGLLLYSPFTDMLSRYLQAISIGGYISEMTSLSKDEIARLRKEAIEYNVKIYEQQLKEPFQYKGEKYDDPEYEKILKISKYSSIMANVEIPKLNIYIPVTHGTKSEDLNNQAGHMHGTSVPIGGKDTHSVIAAHTGLRTADLFSNLTKMKKGDEFLIHVLDEVRVYKINQILTVLPNECNEHLGIEQYEDYVTLYTCTPYGINSHRLLVRGTFDRSYPEKGQLGDDSDILARKIWSLIFAILLGLIPFILLGVGLYFIYRNQEKVKLRKAKRLAKKQAKLNSSKDVTVKTDILVESASEEEKMGIDQQIKETPSSNSILSAENNKTDPES